MIGDLSIAGQLAAAVERLGQAVRVMQWTAAGPLGLSPAQLSILLLLGGASVDRRSVTVLAAELDLSAPTVSDAVAALRRKGLVQATTIGPGRRQRLDLTESGREMTSQVTEWDGPLRAAVESLDPTVQADTLAALLQIIGQLQRSGVVTVARMCTTCRFFGPGDGGQPARCDLLGMPLPPEALRVDCPEHEVAS